MGPTDFLAIVATALNQAGVRYLVSGSMASMIYGELRTTHGIDIVLSIGRRDVPLIVAAFPESDWYCDEPMIRDAIERLAMFNVVHHHSRFKVDFIVVDEDGFNASRFDRRRQIDLRGVKVWVSSPEDVILRKLMSFREGQSDKHLRDIASMFKVSGEQFDRPYLDHWALRLGVLELWNYIVARVEGREQGGGGAERVRGC